MVLDSNDCDCCFLTLAIPRNDSVCIHTHFKRMHAEFCNPQDGIIDRMLLLLTDPGTSHFLNTFVPLSFQQQAPLGLGWYLLLSTRPDIVPNNLHCCFTYTAITWRPGVSQRCFRIATPTDHLFWLTNVSTQRFLRNHANEVFPLVWTVKAYRTSVGVSRN